MFYDFFVLFCRIYDFYKIIVYNYLMEGKNMSYLDVIEVLNRMKEKVVIEKLITYTEDYRKNSL